MNGPADTASTPDLAVAVTAFNSIRTIERTLESVRGLARRVVVVDSGSTDGTVERCCALGAEVIHQEWLGYDAQKQLAIDRAAGHRWTMLLDSDESVEPELAASIRAALRRDDTSIDGYEVNRKLWFLGAWLHRCFQPEWRLRIFRSGRGRVQGEPHDAVVVPGRTARLDGDLRHDSWRDAGDMLARQLGYARVLAARGHGGGTMLRILVSPSAAFLKQFVLRGGMLDGWRGVVVSGGTAAATLMKHLLLAEARHAGTRQREARP